VKKKYWDLTSGIFLFLFSIALFIGAQNVKTLSISSIGSGTFPSFIAVILAIVSVAIIVGGAKKARGPDEKSAKGGEKQRFWAVLATFAIMALYALLMPKVGFIITTMVYLFLQMYIMAAKEHQKPILFGIISIVTSVSVYYMFVKIFSLMLPAGILG
jgi:hypothetical protein